MRWEYKVLKLAATGFWVGGNLDEEKYEQLLNELGGEGWELVSSFDTNKAHGSTRDVISVLKRPRS